MGWSFRKSKSLGGGFRLNMSKKGLGLSWGVKGARIGIGPRGVTRTVSIPGTGIYNRKTTSLHKMSSAGNGSSGGTNFPTGESTPTFSAGPNPNRIRWYQRTGWIVFFLIMLPPVGVFMMWRYKHWPAVTKGITSGVFGVWFIILIIAFSGSGGNNAASLQTSSGDLAAQTNAAAISVSSSEDASSSTPLISIESSSAAVSSSSIAASSATSSVAIVSSVPATPAVVTPYSSTVTAAEPVQSTKLTLVSGPGTCNPGQYATVKIKGKANTSYTCTVTYKSGESKAAGLGTQSTDSNGYASWTWKVGTRTTAGSWPVDIYGNGESIETYVDVT